MGELIRLKTGRTLALEVKGQDSQQNKAKRSALDAWVKAVNTKGGFGTWCWEVIFEPAQVFDVVKLNPKAIQRYSHLSTKTMQEASDYVSRVLDGAMKGEGA